MVINPKNKKPIKHFWLMQIADAW